MARTAAFAASTEAETQEESMLRVVRSMMANGTPGPQTRHLLRVIEDDPRGPLGVLGGKGLDMMHNKARQHPETPEKLASKIRLWQVLDKPQYKDKPLEYEYDFGDCWNHDITIVGRKDATDFFMCTNGDGHYVAEDVGSTPGWEKLKAAYRADRPTEDQKDKMRWFKQTASNRDGRGLKNGRERSWPKGEINRRLAELAGKAFSFT